MTFYSHFAGGNLNIGSRVYFLNSVFDYPSEMAIPGIPLTHHSHFAGGKCGQQCVPQESPVIPVRVYQGMGQLVPSDEGLLQKK